MQLPNPGDYVAKLNGRIVLTEAKTTGSLLAVLPCVIAEGEHVGFKTYANVCIVKSDGAILTNNMDNLKAIFGFDGTDPFVLMDNDYADITFMLAGCKHEEYEGKMQFKPGWVNPLGGGMKMPEPADRKKWLAKCGSKFRALAGGSPVAAPKKPSSPPAPKQKAATPPPPLPPSGPTATMTEAWDTYCEQNPTMEENARQDNWFKEIELLFPGKNNSDLSPHDWGKLKEHFEDNVPA